MITRIASGKDRTGIRPLNPARDLGQLADLIEQAFGPELTGDGQRVLREIRLLSRLGPLTYLFAGMSPEIDGLFTGYVWERDGRVAGNVTVNRPTGHPWRWQISNVAVLERYRRQGIGRKLVEEAIDLILRRGGRTAYLFVRNDNPPAVHLYETLGFVGIDSTTELEFDPQPDAIPMSELRILRPLRPQEGEALYDLVSRAAGPGYRWLYSVRRRQYVHSWSERFFRRMGSLFGGEIETRWCISSGRRLDAGVRLRVRRLWNLGPHRLQLWVHPNRRGRVEDGLARDVVALLSRRPRRAARLSLPGCEEGAIMALIERGFHKVRTLVLMKLDL